jgi:uncharacterized protein (DUF1330 family)
MAAYAVVNVRVTDPDRYGQYREKAPQTIAQYGGRYLARGGTVQVLEGKWSPQRLVVLELESVERLREWYGSPEYAPSRSFALRPPRRSSSSRVSKRVSKTGGNAAVRIEAKLEELSFVLPEPMQSPSGL